MAWRRRYDGPVRPSGQIRQMSLHALRVPLDRVGKSGSTRRRLPIQQKSDGWLGRRHPVWEKPPAITRRGILLRLSEFLIAWAGGKANSVSAFIRNHGGALQ